MDKRKLFKQWGFTLILVLSVAVGALIGHFKGPEAKALKPFGDLFLNLLFTAVVPLVFFSISSVIASNSNLRRLGKLAGLMLIIFVATGIISSCLMIITVKVFDPAKGLENIKLEMPEEVENEGIATKIVNNVSVQDFPAILSRQNILALLIFSVLIGLASHMAGEKGEAFRNFLISGAEVMGKVIRIIMYYAPIGLAGYFAYLVAEYGPDIMGTYKRSMSIYYPFAILYFVFGYTVFTFVAGGLSGVGKFWKYSLPVSMTALGTSSSLAALPMNLEAAEKIGVPEDIREIVLPIGATIHMDGACISAILKIAVLFSFFGRDFSGLDTYALAIGVALLCGVVMSGIPGGGYIGEMLILSLYGFGLEALPIISMLGTLVDPIATMINSPGDTAAAMMVHRLLGNKNGVQAKEDAVAA